ncbi:MAG: hypothetical protein DI570_21790 [Phenylobacterium zucineum]|nr:MAG: hypothetical protein DI570_21790 [Phenylobacterium zucineum]
MMNYRPDKFTSLYETALVQSLWRFMNEPATVARLETASELSKTGVEGIEEPLLREFGEEVLAERVKQMVGHMIRQVLEHRGWVLDQGDVKIQSGAFTKASRYRRPDWVTLHAFRNSSDPRDVAITDRRQNPSLPSDGRWTYYATFASPIKAAVAFGVRDLAKLREAIQARGFERIRVERMMRRA